MECSYIYCKNFNRHTYGYCTEKCRDADIQLFIEEQSIVDIDLENYCSCAKCGRIVNTGNYLCDKCYS